MSKYSHVAENTTAATVSLADDKCCAYLHMLPFSIDPRPSVNISQTEIPRKVAAKLKKKADDAEKLQEIFIAIDVDGLGLLRETWTRI